MGKVSSRIWVGILAVLMGGCGLLGGGSDKPDVASTAATPPAPAATKAAAKSEPEPGAEPIVAPLASAQNTELIQCRTDKAQPNTGLIQSTDKEQRIREIDRCEGQPKDDPFKLVKLEIVEPPDGGQDEQIGPEPGPEEKTDGGDRDDPIADGNNGDKVQQPPTRARTVEPITFPTLPQMEPLPPIGRLAIAVRPALLQPPEIATGVTVSGVMELGGELQAIVTGPNEQTRKVKVGDRLASGAVRVKRIEINSGGLPEVILEENGYEVARVLGEKPSSEEQR